MYIKNLYFKFLLFYVCVYVCVLNKIYNIDETHKSRPKTKNKIIQER